jgi:hypothetical protein
MDDIAEQIMMENRVPSTRDGWVIKVGMKVMGVFDNKVSTVTEIDGDSYKDGGFIILTDAQVENYDDDDDDCEPGVYSDEELFHHDDNSASDFWERSSFCEVCFIHFNTEFVEWSHENRNYEPFYELEGLRLGRPHSMCRRCAQPQAKVLWAWLGRRFKVKAITTYWWHLGHAPKYASTHAAIADADMQAAWSASNS